MTSTHATRQGYGRASFPDPLDNGGLGAFPAFKIPKLPVSLGLKMAAFGILGVLGNLLFLAAGIAVVCLILNHFGVI